MSGGVDSSVAAALLREQGYDVVGIAMRLAPDKASSVRSRPASCCSQDDFEDARRVAERLDFPFYIIDLRSEFKTQVIDNFVAEYLAGRTPNPCVMCNREIKFDRLFSRAAALGAEFVATGHYARIERDDAGRFHLLRAFDQSKDQSYFLFTLAQQEMARTLFPLGRLCKSEVRAIARRLGLANADKPESQEICFVSGRNYAAFVDQSASLGQIRPGRIRDRHGQELARHNGIHQFTVGQRRGLGVAGAAPLYVHTIDAETGDVTVRQRDELASAGLLAGSVHLTYPEIGGGGEVAVTVKIRSRQPPLTATLQLLGEARAQVEFCNAGPPVTPGQACVFYRGDEVLGGGIIEAPLEL
jgi:tRNA-specific 2-thiouridylase